MNGSAFKASTLYYRASQCRLTDDCGAADFGLRIRKQVAFQSAIRNPPLRNPVACSQTGPRVGTICPSPASTAKEERPEGRVCPRSSRPVALPLEEDDCPR